MTQAIYPIIFGSNLIIPSDKCSNDMNLGTSMIFLELFPGSLKEMLDFDMRFPFPDS